MTKQDLRLWYKQDNGKDIPDISSDMYDNEIKDCNKYIEWLEEGLMAAKEIIQNLQSDIITNKSMNK